MIHAIFAINRLGYIGLNGKLPWDPADYPDDNRLFWKMITGETVLVGKRTYDGMQKTRLHDLCREVYVIDRDTNLDALVGHLTLDNKDIWVIGGKSLYKRLASKINCWHISKINDITYGDTHLDLGRLL